MAKTAFGILNPGATAREVIERLVDKVNRDIDDMAANYRENLTSAVNDPEKMDAAVRKLEATYRAMAEERIAEQIGTIWARIKERRRRILAGYRFGGVAPAP